MAGEQSFFNRKGNDVWWYGGASFTRASYTWGGAHNFHDFLRVSKRGTLASHASKLGLADVVQLKNASNHVYHTMVVTNMDNSDLLLSYHTSDHRDEPLSDIARRLAKDHAFVFWRISDHRT